MFEFSVKQVSLPYLHLMNRGLILQTSSDLRVSSPSRNVLVLHFPHFILFTPLTIPYWRYFQKIKQYKNFAFYLNNLETKKYMLDKHVSFKLSSMGIRKCLRCSFIF